jgi:hypothetical protein
LTRLCSLLVFLLLLCADTAFAAGASVWRCDGNADGFNECLCIAWAVPGGERLEMRCPGSGGNPGGGDTPPDGYIQPTWGGGGTPVVTSPAPGMPLSAAMSSIVSGAQNRAKSLVAGDRDPSTGFRIPNECTFLFNGNLLGKSASSIMASVLFRSGTGLKDSSGREPCADPNVSAWTQCCNHSPYVFICDRFTNLSPSEQAYTLIHEAMHVAGQRENGTTSVTGPNDPPNADQITNTVQKACS